MPKLHKLKSMHLLHFRIYAHVNIVVYPWMSNWLISFKWQLLEMYWKLFIVFISNIMHLVFH